MRTAKILAALCLAGAGALVFTGSVPPEVIAAAADITRAAAYASAGIQPDSPPDTPSNGKMLTAPFGQAATEEPPEQTEEALPPTPPEGEPYSPPDESAARVISQNITFFDDGLDYTAEGAHSGSIYREHYGKQDTPEYITLPSGAQVRNCTEESSEKLLAASGELPALSIEFDTPEPQVLIVHTHTTESYEPYIRDYYDEDFPYRTRDSRHNMVALGEALARSLAECGISAVHDGTIHDYPAYSGAYDRSEDTIRAALEKYPSIKVVIDLHRDAMGNPDGSRIAPAAEVDGKSAAQFMIIAGCDDGRFNMPNYMENFKLACLIQNSAESLYPELARAVLFDYRNYNQHITTGSLLIEVGGHANSLDEALYTSELLGRILADALSQLKE